MRASGLKGEIDIECVSEEMALSRPSGPSDSLGVDVGLGPLSDITYGVCFSSSSWRDFVLLSE